MTNPADQVTENIHKVLVGYDPSNARDLAELLAALPSVAEAYRLFLVSLKSKIELMRYIDQSLAEDLDESAAAARALGQKLSDAGDNFYRANKFWLAGIET